MIAIVIPIVMVASYIGFLFTKPGIDHRAQIAAFFKNLFGKK